MIFTHWQPYATSLADAVTMHLSKAMQQSDRDKSVKAMEKEISDHTNNQNWSIHTCAQMQKIGFKGRVIMAVWSFK
jgi:hypothetical protein